VLLLLICITSITLNKESNCSFLIIFKLIICSPRKTVTGKAQIDLVIDRDDRIINLCEMKFSINPFTIEKKYAIELRNKIGVFKQETNTRKSVFLTLITTFGLKTNEHSTGLVQNDLTAMDLCGQAPGQKDCSE